MGAGIPAKRDMLNLPAGTELGRYELVRRIAVGGMAELYLARTKSIGGFEKLVVVKRILPHYNSDESFTRMFMDEAKLAATLHHHNIAQVYDIAVDEGGYFFAMEYVHGADLRSITDMAAERGLEIPLDVAITIVIGAATGLHYAHEKVDHDGAPLGIVHRDVSPQNLLVSYDGTVKLTDFGIAKAANSDSRTASGSLKGKVSYMSPEQCGTDLDLDRRSDIFPLGTILWELSVGRRLFKGDRDFAVIRSIYETDAPKPSSVRPDYPATLQTIVMRALARSREKRFATAEQLQHALEDFAHEQRLRTAPRTLAVFMKRLFGEKLDEWKSAVEQGAYFVEEHVVKTLDGQIPSSETEATGIHRGPLEFGEEETTAVQASPEPVIDEGIDIDEGEPTNVTANPLLGRAPTPTPVPVAEMPTPTPVPVAEMPTPTPVPVAEMPTPTPVPVAEMPTPTPVPVAEMPTPTPVPVASSASSAPDPDFPRRYSEPPRRRRARWWLAVPILAAAGGVLAAVAITAGGDGAKDTTRPAASPEAEAVRDDEAAAPTPAAAEPEETAEPDKRTEPEETAAPEPAEPTHAVAEPTETIADSEESAAEPTSDTEVAARPSRRDRKRSKKRKRRAERRAKSTENKKPKKQKKRKWNKDSIFMPD